MYQKIINEIEILAEPQYAEWIKPFLNIKTEKDDFVLGVRVPKLRKLASKYKNIDTTILVQFLKSKTHEHKLLALFIMLYQVKNKPLQICNLYLDNLNYINNWDLIDYTAPHIVAPNITENKLRELANSDYLWANRVAMVSTIYYIKQNNYNLAIEFAKKYINHPHHLMHKAAGWMLREIGKRDLNVLLKFLEKNEKIMPSIMRNYAKEKLKKH